MELKKWSKMTQRNKYLKYTLFFRMFFVVSLIYSIFQDNLNTVVPSFISLFICFLSERNLDFLRKIKILNVIIASICVALSLLMLSDFLTFSFWWWDLMLHALFGFMLGFLGYIILILINNNINQFILVMAFMIMFSTFAGVVWESYAYISDVIVGSTAIRTVEDTVTDLIADAAGGTVASLLNILLIKNYN